jgi:predicted XRE-type DNA-binding protein
MRLENTPAEVTRMTMRSDLTIALRQHILEWDVTPAEAARRLEVTQPCLNDLLQGRIMTSAWMPLLIWPGKLVWSCG